MHFFNFLKKFFENFRKFSGVRGAQPPGPLRDRPPKVFSPNRNPGAPLWHYLPPKGKHQAKIAGKSFSPPNNEEFVIFSNLLAIVGQIRNSFLVNCAIFLVSFPLIFSKIFEKFFRFHWLLPDPSLKAFLKKARTLRKMSSGAAYNDYHKPLHKLESKIKFPD